MTAGAKAKLQVDGVISICSTSGTNDLVVLNEFENRLWDCLARRRQTAMVCGQKINAPGCVAPHLCCSTVLFTIFIIFKVFTTITILLLLKKHCVLPSIASTREHTRAKHVFT